MSTATVRAAGESERNRVIATIVAGFIADPVTRWLWPHSESYLTNMGRFANAYGGKAFRHGLAWTDSDFRGSALWLPPGEHPDEEELGGIVAATLEERKQGLLLAALEELGRYHPEEPHWFLPLIAVDPSWQGNGIGSRLMQHAVAQCDATNTRAYLESSNPRNISLYERHGFRVVGEVRHGDCPVFTPMLRDPQ
jgi:ribosomal protein S18 acetylase RimI-like enzyme